MVFTEPSHWTGLLDWMGGLTFLFTFYIVIRLKAKICYSVDNYET